MLEVSDLECARGDRVLFRGLKFTLAPGRLLHLQGANGCGKTTLLRALAGLSQPVEGEIRWRGALIAQHRQAFAASLCYIGHLNALQGELNAMENLRFAAWLNGNGTDDRAIQKALDRLGLWPYARLPAKVLSQGQKRRLTLARLLLAEKPLWILDEPYTALDAASCARIGALLDAHLVAGGLVLMASHQALNIDTAHLQTLSLDANGR
jgi:heme exporter protein A